MLVDTDHLHHWMQAIRQSKDPVRTMDAFWSGQLKSKEWLIHNLKPFVTGFVTVEICGGWVGVLSSMLFQSDIGYSYKSITSIDIDPSCKPIADTMNKLEEMQGRFKSVVADMCLTTHTADIIINTSCEHITQEQYDSWLERIPQNSLIVLQSNNYDIPEHIRLAHSLDEFIDQSHLTVAWQGQIELPAYTRYMIIGYKTHD